MWTKLIRCNIYRMCTGKKPGDIPNIIFNDTRIPISSITSNYKSRSFLPLKLYGLNETTKNHRQLQKNAPLNRQFIEKIYRDFLISVENKDKQNLTKMLDPELIDPFMNSQNLKVINKQAELEIYFQRLEYGLDDIKKYCSRDITDKDQNDYFTLLNAMDLSNTDFFFTYYRQFGVSVMQSLYIYIKSKCSLAYPGQIIQKEQIHKLVLQQKQKRTLDQFLYVSQFVVYQQLQLQTLFLDKNAPWRIGNIDYYFQERAENKHNKKQS